MPPEAVADVAVTADEAVAELVALNVEDLEEADEGLRVTIRCSKTDQEGHGETIAIIRGGSTCPVKAVKACTRSGAAS